MPETQQPPQQGGYVKLWRSASDNGHLQMPDQCWKLFSFLLLNVNHKQGAGCKPGEGWITYRAIKEACCDPDKPPWADSTISRALDYLEGKNPRCEQYIERIHTKTGGAQRIRLVNWPKHQGESSSDMQEVPLEVLQEVPLEVALEKQEGKEREEDISSSQPSAEKPKRQRTKKPKDEPDPFNVAAKPILERLDKWMKANQTAGISNWGAATKIMASALKGTSGPAIPADEIVEAIAWGTRQPRWKSALLGKGAEVVRTVWADWKTGGTSSTGGNRYQDHTKIQPTGESVLE